MTRLKKVFGIVKLQRERFLFADTRVRSSSRSIITNGAKACLDNQIRPHARTKRTDKKRFPGWGSQENSPQPPTLPFKGPCIACCNALKSPPGVSPCCSRDVEFSSCQCPQTAKVHALDTAKDLVCLPVTSCQGPRLHKAILKWFKKLT